MNKFLQQPILTVGEYTLTFESVIGVIITIVITMTVLFLFRTVLLRRPSLTVSERGRRNSFYLLIKYFLIVIAFTACIEILGFKITILLAGSAALLVGLGLGVQDIFKDYVSGLFLLFERTIKVGDIMEVGEVVGRVQHISLRSSILHSRDGMDIIIPNHKFITENVINWSHQSFTCRFEIDVGVAYDSDVEKVRDILLQSANEQPQITNNELFKPSVRLQKFGDSALEFRLLIWTDEIFRVERVKSQIRFRIVRYFREQGVTIPFPQRDLHVKDMPPSING